MCVDDDEDGRAVATLYLSQAGFMVHEAGDGEHALEIVREKVIDLVVLDLALPGLDGHTVARTLRCDARTAHIPLVAFTAHVYPADRRLAFASGFDAFIAKPASPDEVLETVQRLLDRPNAVTRRS